MIYTIQSMKINERPLPIMPISIGIEHLTTTFYSLTGWSSFQLYYCRSGKGEVYINHQRRIIKKDYGFLIYPGDSFSYNATEAPWTLDQISFDGCLASSLMTSLGLSQSDVFMIYDQNLFRNHLQKILELMQHTPVPEPEEFSKCLYSFLLDLPGSLTHIPRDSDITAAINENDLMLKIIGYMEIHFSENFSLDELAEYVGLTKSYMCTLFKKVTHRTIITELTYIRLGKARIFLVQNPEKSVREIAAMCGYEDAGYFGRVFKKITGTTPEQYRRG